MMVTPQKPVGFNSAVSLVPAEVVESSTQVHSMHQISSANLEHH